MIRMKGKTRIDVSGLRRFEKRLEQLVKTQVEEGFYDDMHYSGLTNAQLMTIHEFGYGGLPQRNVMLSSSLSFQYQLPKLVKQIYRNIVVNGKSPEVALKLIGQKFVETTQFVIDAGLFSNNQVSKEWSDVKGFSEAMIHYGDLKDSCQYKITKSEYTFKTGGSF